MLCINRMKRNHKDTLLILLFLIVLSAFLYYLFYKPVEGFFAKKDACDVAVKNREFIQNQVNTVSGSLDKLQKKFDSVGNIRAEIQGYLTKYDCLQFNSSDPVCNDLVNQFNSISAKLTNALADKKLYEEKEVEANTEITKATNGIKINTEKLPPLIDLELNVLKCKEKDYADSNNTCSKIKDAKKQFNDFIKLDTEKKDKFQKQLDASKQNIALLSKSIPEFDAQKKSLQSQLDQKQCTKIKSTFACNEFRNQLKFLEKIVDNAKTAQKTYSDFFKAKSAPLDDIKKLVADNC
jgi:hypothetical protein